MNGTRAVRPRAIVIGGSLGGLSAALWLRDAGCEVEVFERSTVPLESRGAGIVLNPATIRYLVDRRGLDVEEVGAGASWFRYLAADGSIAYEEPGRYRFTSYGTLYRALLGVFDERRYHLGRECVGFEQDTDGVTIRFADGASVEGDLLVFADGINSLGRRLLLPQVSPRFAGYVAWRGTIGEGELTAEAFDALHEAITYVLTADSHGLAYPIPSREGVSGAGERLLNWLWYRNVPPAEIDDLLRTGRGGGGLTTSVPPGRVAERHLRRLREAAAILPPVFAEMIARTEEPFIQAVFDVAIPQMAFGRACLIGDGAFVARPHAAAGTAKAAEDARKLAEALRAAGGEVARALRRWEPDQLALGRQLVARSREAGERLQGGRWRFGEPLAFGLYRTGDSSLAEPSH